MFKIVSKIELAKEIAQITVEAPEIAQKAKAGQFIALVLDEKGERIPLTLADWDRGKGTITLIFQKVGFTTKKLGSLNIGDNIAHILGPLGHPTDIKNIGEVYCIGGGVGIAEVYPVSRAFKEAGNRITAILGARRKDLIILENKMREACDELFITTDDGSYEKKGFVTDVLKDLIDVIEKSTLRLRSGLMVSEVEPSTNTKYPGLVYAIGPVPMMKGVCELTKGYSIKTVVSINPIMIDATGMCGACRCTVNGKTLFGCVDGPDFDGHKIDFDQLQSRLNLFTPLEMTAHALYLRNQEQKR